MTELSAVKQIAEAFMAAAKLYTSDPIEIELIDGQPGCGLGGTVNWDPGAREWKMLINANCTPETMVRRGWHELAHLLHGDVGKHPDAGVTFHRMMKSVLTGNSTPAAVGTLEGIKEAESRGRLKRIEDRADEWEIRTHMGWWPVISTGDLAAVRATVEQLRVKGMTDPHLLPLEG